MAPGALPERGGAGGTRTLTALRPGDFKSPMSTISSPPPGLMCYVDMILTCSRLFVNHFCESDNERDRGNTLGTIFYGLP